MKRRPALRQLSRDHHRALVVAQLLKRADEATALDARQHFLDYWNSEGREHFREEEEILLPALARFADLDEPIVARVLVEHVRIRALAEHPEDVAQLRELGSQLEQHVRREERELFALIERAMPGPDLTKLAERLKRSPP
jgi:iron-sulfur cluster repair protein YtfE (RIC family)